MPSSRRPPLVKIAYAVFTAVILFFVVNNIRQTLPPRTVVIETGPVGGSYHDNAMHYARKLAVAGFKTEIRPNPQSLETIDRIDSGKPHVDIGFTIQPLDRLRYRNTLSAGVVELQPLFVFYNVEKNQFGSLDQLLGKRLVMPPEKSVSAEAARSVLALYGVTPDNSTFTYLPIAVAQSELKRGLHDAGFFMLAPSNAIVLDLVETKNLRLLSITQDQGISRRLAFLKPTLLPLGAYDLQRALPSTDLHMLGGTVNVMVRRDINPALLYALLDAMNDTHQEQTLVSNRGEFPTTVGTSLDAHPLATQWQKTGIPWVFSTFGPVTASLIDKYSLLILALVMVANIYSTVRYLYELMKFGASSLALGILLKLQQRAKVGKSAGPISRKLYEAAERLTTLAEDRNKRSKALLEQLKTTIT